MGRFSYTEFVVLPYYVLAFSVYLFACSKDGERACDVNSPWVKSHITLRICEDVRVYLVADLSWEHCQKGNRHGVDFIGFAQGPPLLTWLGAKPLYARKRVMSIATSQPRDFISEGKKKSRATIDSHLPTLFQESIIVSPTFLFFDNASGN